MAQSPGNVTHFPRTVVRTEAPVTALCLLVKPRKEITFLVAGRDDGIIEIWNILTQTVKQTIKPLTSTESKDQSGMILGLEPLSDNLGFISHVRFSGVYIYVWNNESSIDSELVVLNYVSPMKGLHHTFCSSCWIAELSLLIQPNDESCRFLQLNSELTHTSELCSIECKDEGTITSISAHLTDNGIISVIIGTEAGNLLRYTNHKNGNNMELRFKLDLYPTEPVLCMDYNSRYNYGVSASTTNLIKLWRINETEDSLLTHLDFTVSSNGFNKIKIRPDCKLFISAAWDGIVRLHSVRKGTLLATLDFHRESAMCCVFDENYCFFTSSKDKIICVWDLYANKSVHV